MTSQELCELIKNLKQVKNDYQYSYDKVGESGIIETSCELFRQS